MSEADARGGAAEFRKKSGKCHWCDDLLDRTGSLRGRGEGQVNGKSDSSVEDERITRPSVITYGAIHGLRGRVGGDRPNAGNLRPEVGIYRSHVRGNNGATGAPAPDPIGIGRNKRRLSEQPARGIETGGGLGEKGNNGKDTSALYGGGICEGIGKNRKRGGTICAGGFRRRVTTPRFREFTFLQFPELGARDHEAKRKVSGG